MAFTLYAAGTTTKETDAFKREIGYHQLLSQYTEKKHILEWVDYLKEHPECKCNLFIDSGAFTAHTKGVTIDVDEYIEFLNSIDDYTTVFAQLDTIAGIRGQEVTIEQQLEAPKLSWENYLYMKDRVKSRDKLIPVFHQQEDFKWLKNMLEYTHEDGSHIKYIGISPNKSLPSSTWKPWLEKVFTIIKNSSNPNVKTHAFGISTYKILENFPFTSSDSTTWLKLAAFGQIQIGKKTLFTSNRKICDDKHVLNQSPAVIEAVKNVCTEMGMTLDDLLTDDDIKASRMRELFNLRYGKDWANNYVYCGNNIHKNELF